MESGQVQRALEGRVALSRSNHNVIAKRWHFRRGALGRCASFWDYSGENIDVLAGRALAVIDPDASGGGWVPRPLELLLA